MAENPYESSAPAGDASAQAAVASRKKSLGSRLVELLVVVAIVGGLVALLLPATRRARPAAERTQCKNNLKRIAIALHDYAEEHGGLPPAWTVDGNGNRLHSWRVLILPYLEHAALYESIDLNRPWDHPVNREAHRKCPDVYRCPSSDVGELKTTYLALVGESRALRPDKVRPLSEISDSQSETLAVIEVADSDAVHWMSPVDLTGEVRLSEDAPFGHIGGTQCAMIDGTVTFLLHSIEPEILRSLSTVAGGELIDETEL